MNKIKTKQIDGYEIITGIAQLTPDPAATHAHCEPLVHAEPKSTEVREKKKEMLEKNRRASQITQQTRALMINRQTMQRKSSLTADEKLQFDKLENEWQTLGIEARETQSELKTLSVEVDECRKDHRRGNPVFGMPGAGEYIDRGLKIVGPDATGQPVIMTESALEDAGCYLPGGQTVEEMTALWMGRGENRECTVDGEYVCDYRDKTEWVKTENDVWIGYVLKEIGEEKNTNAIFDEDLTTEQRSEIDSEIEALRITELSAEDKTAEYTAARAGLLSRAGAMKSELEIDGDSDHLGKSQAWFLSGESELKIKYGVS